MCQRQHSSLYKTILLHFRAFTFNIEFHISYCKNIQRPLSELCGLWIYVDSLKISLKVTSKSLFISYLKCMTRNNLFEHLGQFWTVTKQMDGAHKTCVRTWRQLNGLRIDLITLYAWLLMQTTIPVLWLAKNGYRMNPVFDMGSTLTNTIFYKCFWWRKDMWSSKMTQ